MVGLGGWSRPAGDAEVKALLSASDVAIVTQVDNFLAQRENHDSTLRATMSISDLAREVAFDGGKQHEGHESDRKRARVID